ncbi:PhyA2 [Ectocarpus siliculosus]|uniref:PhyA2 n=1 Tax=Ectocarpus siliculosus TaxID=2880 RepID=D7G0I7_ECTSI|nr:PhyA2 [Ectocarpus siliculosus]|eukprot:CBJ33016.1 PhyA2 [Ectocarpus siliculosus]
MPSNKHASYSHALKPCLKPLVLATVMMVTSCSSRTPDGLIVVSRHGVRRQFPSSTHDFSKYAPGKTFETEDKDWGVDGSMGVLTQHGYDAAHLMGKFQGQKYAGDGLPLDSCSDMFVYCEEDMPRDEFTAEAFFKGFTEGWTAAGGDAAVGSCPVPEPHFEEVEYLIDQGSKPRGDAGQCRLGSEQEVQGVVGKVDEWTRLLRSKLQKLNDVLGCCDRSLCPADHPEDQPCTLMDMPHVWDEEHWYVTFTGPVYAGKYFSEWFLLNYLNGMDVAWGELSEEDVMDLAAFVTEYRHFEFDLLAARPFGSALLMHVVAALDQMETGENLDAVAHTPDVKLVYYAAHDTNLLYLAELLDLKWVSKGWQPNHTPPGGELVFEAYMVDGELNVAAFFDIATPSQIRELTDLSPSNPPGRVAITIPGCSQGEELLCPLSKLRALAIRSVDAECITPPELVEYVSDSWAKDAVVLQAEAAQGGDDDVVMHARVTPNMGQLLVGLMMGLAVGGMAAWGLRSKVGAAGLRNRGGGRDDDNVELLRDGGP